MAGGLARVSPVPVTDQDLRLKAVVTARPRRPEAPVTRAVWEDMVAGVVELGGLGMRLSMRLGLRWRGYVGGAEAGWDDVTVLGLFMFGEVHGIYWKGL